MPTMWPSREDSPGERAFARAGLARDLAPFAAPLAAFAAMVSFAAFEADPASGVESAFLARVAAGALLAVAALAPPPALEVALGSVLAAAVVWVLPPGPSRGAAMAALLAVCLAVAAARRLARTLPALPISVSLPLALGIQMLMRGNLLLVPVLEPRPLIVLLGLPVMAAATLSLLAQRHGGERALLAGAMAALLGPGWTIASTTALVALAAGSVLSGPLPRRISARWLVQAAAVAALLAPMAWEWRAGALGAAAGLTLAFPRLGLALAAGLAVAGLGLPAAGEPQGPQGITTGLAGAVSPAAGESNGIARWLAGLALPGDGAPDRIAGWLALPLLVPAALLPERARWRTAVAALLLALASRAVPGPAAAVAPLALAALSISPGGAAAAVQGLWSGALVLGTALAAAYPWLREVPLATALAPLGPPPLVALGAVVATLLARFGWDYRVWTRSAQDPAASTADFPAGTSGALRRMRIPAAAAPAAAALLFLAVLVARLPGRGNELLPAGAAVQLDAGHPAWEAELSPRPVSSVVVDTALANSASLPAGTPVATVRLGGTGSGEVAWTLRAGRETGEWAARRVDLAAAIPQSPPAWLSFVAGDFFGQRYRGVLGNGRRNGPFTRVRVERAAGLPADLSLALHGLELRP